MRQNNSDVQLKQLKMPINSEEKMKIAEEKKKKKKQPKNK